MVWGLAGALDGRVMLRIEDHDAGRCRPEFADGILDDLAWLGLTPNDGDAAAPRAWPISYQHDRGAHYATRLAALDRAGQAYACRCSRRDIVASTAATATGEMRYPGTCRVAGVPAEETAARRVLMVDESVEFDDVILGKQRQRPAAQCGDVLIRERSGLWTYQFAVTVDDAEQGIDVVIRGADLLASTGRQIQLARALGRTVPPVFAHHTLVRHDDGSKLSKSTGATALGALRAAGWTPAQVLGTAARLAGLQSEDRSIAAADLAALFSD